MFRVIINDVEEKENQDILILKSQNVLRETFGRFKDKIKESSQEMKNRLRRELYRL